MNSHSASAPPSLRTPVTPGQDQLGLTPELQCRLESILLTFEERRKAAERWAPWLANSALVLGCLASLLYGVSVYTAGAKLPDTSMVMAFVALIPALIAPVWWMYRRFRTGYPPQLNLAWILGSWALAYVLIAVSLIFRSLDAPDWLARVIGGIVLAALLVPYALLPFWVHGKLLSWAPSYWAARRDPEARAVKALYDFYQSLAVHGADRRQASTQKQLGGYLIETISAIEGRLPKIFLHDPSGVRRSKRKESRIAAAALRRAMGCLAPEKSTDPDLVRDVKAALISALLNRWPEIGALRFGCAPSEEPTVHWAGSVRAAILASGIALGAVAHFHPDVLDKAAAQLPRGGPFLRAVLYLIGYTSLVMSFAPGGPCGRVCRQAFTWLADVWRPLQKND